MGNTNTVPKSQDGTNPKKSQHQKDDDQPPTTTNPIKEEEEEEEPQQQQEMIENQETSSAFTCEICIEPMLSNNRFKNQDKCVHPFCMDCMTKYIQVKVEDDASADVECPGLDCKQLLDPVSCRPLIAHQLFVKWCDNLCESALLGLDRCYCPYQDCSALVLNECGEIKGSSNCPNCKKMFCFRCKIPWHAGYRCDESGALRDRNDVLFGQLLERKKWVRCPGCGHSIERIAGCSIVKCRCKTSFCYNCGEKGVFLHGCPICSPITTIRGIYERILFVVWCSIAVLSTPLLLIGFILYQVGRAIYIYLMKPRKTPIQQQPNDPNSNIQV